MNLPIKFSSLVTLGFLLLSPISVVVQLEPIVVLAQTSQDKKTQADRLIEEADGLAADNFIKALDKYTQALQIYRQIRESAAESATRQKLESALVAAQPLAEQEEKEMMETISNLIAKYPKTENNITAIRLQELTASKLGFAIRGSAEDAPMQISEVNQKAFEGIRKELNQYIEAQIKNPTNKIDQPPEKLRRYLAANADTLAALRTLILNNEQPRWATDVTQLYEKNYSYALPSHLGIVNLQKILALDILEKQRAGKTQEMQEALEVSWKIGQSLQNSPFLIGQLVSIINTRIQAGVMRKLDNLPSKWQERLLAHDYRKSLLTSLEVEMVSTVGFFNQVNPSEVEKQLEELELDAGLKYLKSMGWQQWSESLRKNYLRWIAINNFQTERRIAAQLAQENICNLNYDSWLERQDINKALFFPEDVFAGDPGYGSFGWVNSGRFMLELELTQKILQVKELAAKAGTFPQSVPSMDSSVCPGSKWIYQVSPNGTMSISLSPIPAWLSEYKGLPLTYRKD